MVLKTVFLSIHYYKSARRAGFHWLADAMSKAGHQVCFMTVGFSLASYLRRDHRIFYPEIRKERNRLISVGDRLESYVHYTPWHPVNLLLPPLNALSEWVGPWYAGQSLGEAEERLRDADLILYESSFGLYFFHRLKELNPHAAHVYRVSDDIGLLRMPHPGLQVLERKLAPQFDLVSVPSEYLSRKFHAMPGHVSVQVQLHGIAKELFFAPSANPYADTPGIHAVYVGAGWFDESFLEAASRVCSDIIFHVIGPFSPQISRKNVRYYGEMKHGDTIPYLQHADIGLHTIEYRLGAETFTDSLKVLQYCACGLPIVAPDFVRTSRTNTFYYAPGDCHSISAALRAAAMHGKGDDGGIPVQGWSDLACKIADIALLPSIRSS